MKLKLFNVIALLAPLFAISAPMVSKTYCDNNANRAVEAAKDTVTALLPDAVAEYIEDNIYKYFPETQRQYIVESYPLSANTTSNVYLYANGDMIHTVEGVEIVTNYPSITDYNFYLKDDFGWVFKYRRAEEYAMPSKPRWFSIVEVGERRTLSSSYSDASYEDAIPMVFGIGSSDAFTTLGVSYETSTNVQDGIWSSSTTAYLCKDVNVTGNASPSNIQAGDVLYARRDTSDPLIRFHVVVDGDITIVTNRTVLFAVTNNIASLLDIGEYLYFTNDFRRLDTPVPFSDISDVPDFATKEDLSSYRRTDVSVPFSDISGVPDFATKSYVNQTDTDTLNASKEYTDSKFTGSVGLGTPTASANTLASDSSATASVSIDSSSTSSNAILNFVFGIPRGPTGATGAQGPRGYQGIRGIQGIQGPVGPANTTVIVDTNVTVLSSVDNPRVEDIAEKANELELHFSLPRSREAFTNWYFYATKNNSNAGSVEVDTYNPKFENGIFTYTFRSTSTEPFIESITKKDDIITIKWKIYHSSYIDSSSTEIQSISTNPYDLFEHKASLDSIYGLVYKYKGPGCLAITDIDQDLSPGYTNSIAFSDGNVFKTVNGTDYSDQIKSLENQIESLDEEMTDGFADLQNQINSVSNNVQNQINSLDDRLDTVDDRLDTVSEDLTSLENETTNKLASIETTLRSDIDDLDERFTDQLSELSSNVSSISNYFANKIHDLENDVSSLFVSNISLSAKTTALSNELALVKKDVEFLSPIYTNWVYLVFRGSEPKYRYFVQSTQYTKTTSGDYDVMTYEFTKTLIQGDWTYNYIPYMFRKFINPTTGECFVRVYITNLYGDETGSYITFTDTSPREQDLFIGVYESNYLAIRFEYRQ